MPHRHAVPAYRGVLHRSRLHALIQQGLQYPLLVLLAGPGYGKTQAVSSYLAQSGHTALWLRLRGQDNLHAHFWQHLVSKLSQQLPGIAKDLGGLSFPATPSEFDAFLQLLAKGLGGGQMVWVLDDFGEITDQGIKAFLRVLTQAQLQALRIILISNVPTSAESVAYTAGKRFLIPGSDLRFTREEIQALYEMHGVRLDAGELADIERYTEGWPLPLHLLALGRKKLKTPPPYSGQLTHHTVARLFEERFFAPYTSRQQLLLVKLSLLDSFTWNFAVALYDGDRADLATLATHVFIHSDPTAERLFFHNLYRRFLQGKKGMLSTEETHLLWQKAAGHYASLGHADDAITCYRNCGDHAGMLDVITRSVMEQYGITHKNAAFYLQHLNLLTPREVRQHPMADAIRALIYLSTYQLDKAEALLLALEQRLLCIDEPQLLAVLGEAYVMHGCLHMMLGREDFGDYFQKGAARLPQGSRLNNPNRLWLHNNHCFFMATSLPGAKERMERAVHRSTRWAAQALHNGMGGIEHLFSAEAAYLSYQLSSAQQHAYRAIYKAEASAQHDLVCNAYIILARIALLLGNATEAAGQIGSLAAYVKKHPSGTLREIGDTALAWYYTKLQAYGQIPKSILSPGSLEQPVMALGRIQIIHANYLISSGRCAKAIHLLQGHQAQFVSRGVWHDQICLYVTLAVAHLRLGNSRAAIQALAAAYGISHGNGLVTPFIEAEEHMCALAGLARRQRDHVFDPTWLGLVDREAADYAKRLAAARSAYKLQHQPDAAANPLTKREMEVLNALSKGLTREEIADRQFVSVNTVKTFIRNIYGKLGAANRAEAVSIAISRGYIDASPPN